MPVGAEQSVVRIDLGKGGRCWSAVSSVLYRIIASLARLAVALLRCSIGGRVHEANAVTGSDRFGEFVERCRDSKTVGPGVDAEFVVAAA